MSIALSIWSYPNNFKNVDLICMGSINQKDKRNEC